MKMDRGIAAEGWVLKTVTPFGSETVQRLLGPFSEQFLRLLPLTHLNCKKLKIPRQDGSVFRVCVMRGKKTTGKTVGILWLHGGGYALGAPEMAAMTFVRFLLKNCNCVVVSPQYRLSCEAPYPAALLDAYDTFLWMKNHRTELGIDVEKLVVGGESAGGGLTAALCMYARDHGEDHIGLQLPLYPMLDDRPTETSAHNNEAGWNTAANRAAWHIYLGNDAQTDSVSPYAAPARATDFSRLPPAISIIGTIEPFYAETKRYFFELERAGVKTALREYEGAYHAFDMLAPYARISKDASRFVLESYLDFTERYL